jgi:hypothetical protein
LPTGVEASALTQIVNVWGLVDDAQTPNYTDVSTTQTPNYSNINSSQSPDWQEVA